MVARYPPHFSVFCGVKHPLFVDEVLVHEGSESVGVAKVTYYPIDGTLKGIRMGLELANGTRCDFPLSELRQASPEEEKTLKFEPDQACE
jgi:hypothetical protein